jgi:hypothetical protein
MTLKPGFHRTLRLAVAAIALMLTAVVAHAQQAVTVSFEVTGDAVPNGMVQVTANVTINDGSTLQSYSWEQVGGAEAVLSGTHSQTVTAALATEDEYKAYLIEVLMEPPITEEQLPPNVPLPEGEFPGGLQDRFQVVAINPFALEHSEAVVLEVEVVTTSGTYHAEADVLTALPWKVSTGLLNVPINAPVLLHGKDQTSYYWTLSTPSGSGATLMDATSQNPTFTPDVPGHYTVEVDQDGTKELVSLSIYAGTWMGVIVGQDEDGRPIADSSCLGCHNDKVAPDKFTPWAHTGHAEIFTDNLNTSTHYSSSCFSCHLVGYDPTADNDGVDEADDFQAFLDSGLLNNPGDNWSMVLSQFPDTARKANIQCENCHGPQVGGAHLPDNPDGEPRVNLSATVCGSCHGEPLRHGRYQQWQLSGHANYELAIEEGESGSCARCHTANGFLAWLPVLTGDVAGDPTADIEVTWTSEEIHPQTCATCHDPHAIGTTTGEPTNATVRISGDTPPLIAGFTATDVGRGAICMTCHNSRRGLRNDDNFNTEIYGTSEASRAPHLGPQADMIMGQNFYLVDVGQRANHSKASKVQDTCVTCHMEATPPPPDLAYSLGGTNHTFYASPTICQSCHPGLDAADFQGPIEEKMHELETALESSFYNFFEAQTEAGNAIDVGGQATITDAGDIAEIQLAEARGRQALTITFTDDTVAGPTAVNSINVVPPAGAPYEIYTAINPLVIKGFWNLLMLEADGSTGVHNPSFAFQVLERSIDGLNSDIEPCAPDADTMCLNNGRFKVEVTWADYKGGTGPGMVASCGSDDSGLFYFFNEDNWEMLFKVLNGCNYNNHYWVYFAATTDVGFNVRVTDTMTGFTKAYNNKSGVDHDYSNELGHPANAVTDDTAFATCP